MRHWRIILIMLIALTGLQNKALALAWNEIDSPDIITKNHLTSSERTDRKVGNVLQFANNGYALAILAYKKDGTGFKQYIETAGTSLLIMGGTKELKLRKRPDRTDRKSLPSGHVTGAFIPVGFLYYRYGVEYAIAPAITGIFVAYSRVEIKKHYITDTIAGAAISILAGKFFASPYLNNNSLSVIPSIDRNYMGVDIQYNF